MLTKLDEIGKGKDATDILNGNSEVTTKLGIIGVVNRSEEDLKNNVTIRESLENEAQFLQKNYPTLADRNGSKYLEQKLAAVFYDHIQKCLPACEVSYLFIFALKSRQA